MKVLVLGHKGMLGHMVYRYLKTQEIDLFTCNHRWPTNEFKAFIKDSDFDYIVNCIGAIPQRKSLFEVNYELPIWLDKNTHNKIIHQGTDYNGSDSYGTSKQKALDYFITQGKNTKVLKTAIIGPELQNKASLLEWFLSQEGEIDGYTKAIWSGNTTLEWAKYCYEMMINWGSYSLVNTLKGETISKYNLLHIISNIWDKKITINKVDKGVDRSLIQGINTPDITSQLIELKEFYND